MDEYEEAVLFTYALLDSRLERLEYLLAGRLAPPPGERAPTIPDRIHAIEHALQQLAGQTALLDDVRALLSQHGDLLDPHPRAHAHASDAPLDAAHKAALVVERAPAFAATASQLKALDDQQLPSTDGFVELAKLRPRMAEAEARQLQHALKISELRRRTGLLAQRDKQVHYVGAGRCYVEWEKRIEKGYLRLVREEFRRQPEGVEAGAEEDAEGDAGGDAGGDAEVEGVGEGEGDAEVEGVQR